MIQLYQHKWVSTEGKSIKDGEYTNNFKRWCEELSHFTDKHWKRSYNRIEGDIKKTAQMGIDVWPPSSVAVIAYSKCSAMYKSFDRSRAVEDLTEKEKRNELGKAECKKILDMFD